MRLGLTANGEYSIIEGNDVLCQCSTLTEASAVLHYLNMRPITILERGIARTAIHNWDNKVKEKRELKAAKKARQKAVKKETSSHAQEGEIKDVCHREEEPAAESGEAN